MKSCLLFSIGPVPSKNFKVVEGGGLRCWGLAEGFVKNGMKVTIATRDVFPQAGDENELNLPIINWSPASKETFSKLLASFDAVVVSYCGGDMTELVLECIPDHVQLILDCYVPIYVEVSARDSKDKKLEYDNYDRDVRNWGMALGRGDLIICANQSQKEFYIGVLSALGRINPLTYAEEMVIVVPFGIEEAPPKVKSHPLTEQGSIQKEDFVVLWFGGLYPWFSILGLIQAFELIHTNPTNRHIKLVVVGGKNPFNDHPDFVKQYKEVVQYCAERKLSDYIIFKDWVDYQDRFDWYNEAEVIISLNKPGKENRLSWRTRVMDYVWGSKPMITNGGDPLSEHLLQHRAAVRIDDLKPETIRDKILSLNKTTLEEIERNLDEVRQQFFWRKATQELCGLINQGYRPADTGLPHSIIDRIQKRPDERK